MIETDFGFKDFAKWGVFSAGDVAEILKIPRRKVAQYVEVEAVKPTVAPQGTGHARGFGFTDLLRAAVAWELERFGVAPRHLPRFTKIVSHSDPAQHEGGVNLPLFLIFTYDDKRNLHFSEVWPEHDQALLLDRLTKNAGAVVVNFKALFVEVWQGTQRHWKNKVR